MAKAIGARQLGGKDVGARQAAAVTAQEVIFRYYLNAIFCGQIAQSAAKMNGVLVT